MNYGDGHKPHTLSQTKKLNLITLPKESHSWSNDCGGGGDDDDYDYDICW